jgi:hypothetical protein
MWDSLHKSLGRLKENTSHTVNFRFEGAIPEGFDITEIESSCGCTTPKFDRKTGILSAVFKTGKIPKHLEWKKEYNTTKKITAKSTVGTFSFSFSATIFKS